MSSQDDSSLPPQVISTQPFTPQPNSSLLHKLPGELRNRIYRLALVSGDEVRVVVEEVPRGPLALDLGKLMESNDHDYVEPVEIAAATAVPTSTHRFDVVPPMLLSCKQIRHEAAEIYYVENTFQLTTSVVGRPHALAKLEHVLRPWARQITCLQIVHSITFGKYLGLRLTPYVEMNFYIQLVCGVTSIMSDISTVVNCDSNMVGGRQPVCLCKLDELAAAFEGENITQFATKYAHSLLGRVEEKWASDLYIPHCWSCAHREIF